MVKEEKGEVEVQSTEKVVVEAPKAEGKEEEKSAETAVKATFKKKSQKRKYVPRAQVYILCSYNNTMITMTDLNGGVLGWSSAGSLNFKGPKKATPFAATLVAQKTIEKTARFGIKEVKIFVKGVGGGREASIRAFSNAGFIINSIKDLTPTPHNGCRQKKPRRV